MTKTKRPLPPLQLTHQTLRPLTPEQLAAAAGGKHTEACFGTGSRYC